MPRSILLADDHGTFLMGLKGLIENQFGYKDIRCVRTCNELLKELKTKRTHLILDIGLSDGSSLEVLPNIKSLYPDLHIMIYSSKPAIAYEKAARKFQIEHFLSKDADDDLTIDGLKRFFNNEKSLERRDVSTNPLSKLTSREMEVFHYLIMGMGPKQIGNVLNLDPDTISKHKKNILEKVEVSNVADLVNLAHAFNFI